MGLERQRKIALSLRHSETGQLFRPGDLRPVNKNGASTGSFASWVVRRFLKWPPAWIATGIGIAVGTSIVSIGAPWFFGLFFGGILTVVLGTMLSMGYLALKGGHKAEMTYRKKQAQLRREGPRLQLRDELGEAGLWDEAERLRKTGAIVDEMSREADIDRELTETATRTLDLSASLEKAAMERCRDAIGLRKRIEVATGSKRETLEKELIGCQAELADAFDALVTAQETLRKELARPTGGLGADSKLSELTDQLREESEFAERLEARLRRDQLRTERLGGSRLGGSDAQASEEQARN